LSCEVIKTREDKRFFEDGETAKKDILFYLHPCIPHDRRSGNETVGESGDLTDLRSKDGTLSIDFDIKTSFMDSYP
jgi:hypothetical protein